MATREMRMSRPISRYLLVAVPLAVLAFLANPHGPLGGFWAPAPEIAAIHPTGIQLALMLGLNLAEAVTFGAGIAFLLFGYEASRAATAGLASSPLLTRAVHLSISWLLINWWPHDNIHVHIAETNLGALIATEYAFHITLMIAGAILAVAFVRAMRQYTGA